MQTERELVAKERPTRPPTKPAECPETRLTSRLVGQPGESCEHLQQSIRDHIADC